MQAHPVQIEVDISFGLPRFSIVGLPDAAVQESKERIRSALQNNGFSFPKTVITVNLAPAHERKQGSHHDASIAIGLLAAERLIKTDFVKKTFIAAELGLSGELRPVRGIIPLALMARNLGYKHIMTSPEDTNIVKEIPDLNVHGCENLQKLITHLAASKLPENISSKNEGGILQPTSQKEDEHPFKNIRGHHLAKRALIIAISGNHPLLLIGPPGSGKTLLAKSARHLLPPLSFKEALELACINSVQKERASEIFSYRRPFRSPHHHTSPPALIGGGSPIVPGEISLAHHGVLFLDELPEFPKQSLEALREPLEAREVHIARAKDHATFPAATQLICAMNPCPCGYFGDPERTCSCDKRRVQHYQERLSGPLLDRIDLFVDVQRIPAEELLHENEEDEEKRYPDKETIARTRNKQWERFTISGNNLAKYEKLACLTQETKNLFCKAGERLRLSGRGYTKLLRISRTIADLAQSEEILAVHASEALSYRSRLLAKN